MAKRKHIPTAPKRAKLRKAAPVLSKKGDKTLLMCPFCKNKHSISADEIAPCGTYLEIQAVQRTYTDAVCALCGKGGGTFILVGDKYIHTNDCSPGKVLYATPPKKSFTARLAFMLPDATNLWMANKFGKVPIELRNNTGAVAGYTWQAVEIKKVTNAESQRPVS